MYSILPAPGLLNYYVYFYYLKLCRTLSARLDYITIIIYLLGLFPRERFHRLNIFVDVTEPHIYRINCKLSQENDPNYLYHINFIQLQLKLSYVYLI